MLCAVLSDSSLQNTRQDGSQTRPVRDVRAQLTPHLADHNDPPSSSNEDGDTSSFEPGRIWAYPYKHPTCPYYGKTWTLQSNFLNYLSDFKIRREEEATRDRAGRRQCARKWIVLRNLSAFHRFLSCTTGYGITYTVLLIGKW